ncbi:MAG: hypothetical protein JF597_53335 [Streptomyces sp.]|uniref:hypothetical protein n=1 Tax=Streptomyces sp. TaxID=1931 RepID=UPI0025E11DD6|nr:hypothetical protein [Streptomyces sp.]MBW8802000.1 hypothetical protein [Streptomyces sp.]
MLHFFAAAVASAAWAVAVEADSAGPTVAVPLATPPSRASVAMPMPMDLLVAVMTMSGFPVLWSVGRYGVDRTARPAPPTLQAESGAG